jgi:hypothetical protein
MIIDHTTASQPHWLGWRGRELGAAGGFRLWRVDRLWLEKRALTMAREERRANWREKA